MGGGESNVADGVLVNEESKFGGKSSGNLTRGAAPLLVLFEDEFVSFRGSSRGAVARLRGGSEGGGERSRTGVARGGGGKGRARGGGRGIDGRGIEGSG